MLVYQQWTDIMLRRFAGFTLVEAMVSVVILSILAALALPSFNQMVANFRVRTAAEAMLNGLKLARSEAVRRNAQVSFTASGTGWTVAQVAPAATLQTRPAAEGGRGLTTSYAGGNTAVTFQANGRVLAGAALTEITVSSAVTGADTLRVNLGLGGLARLCNPAITAANDPRGC
ncbi:GspH/FimT family pseudopilin [Crenobacter intestini]|uniref:Type II secretion system protein H n=1 Tax=Crenobacter intestini TaxID=2563443 RepID=A0A4T0V6C7_9NEIS|nr:GspH/FimT family pseudopilin [Crenobacter intestini]TIC86991.1 prepilin-type N-terminal cleavage/methylation domain-containing protein [Crenobacter intestini]